jgi:hypothetical protein
MKNLIRQVLKEYVSLVEQKKPPSGGSALSKAGVSGLNVASKKINNAVNNLDEVISGSYSAEGQKGAYDALHSFQSRKSDKFGGRINTKVQNGIKEYKNTKGLNAVDIKKVTVNIDPNTLTVNWEVTIGKSNDGYTYEQFDSRGSAGGGESAVDRQLAGMHSVNSGEPKLVYYFNKTIPKCFDSNGVKLSGGCKGTINIQQKFFKYGKKVK